MKKFKFLSFVLFLTLLTAACTKQDKLEVTEANEPSITLFQSLNDVKALDIDTKFNLSSEIYDRFLNSLIFENNELKGFYFAEVVEQMNLAQQVEFWAYFSFTLQVTRDVAEDAEVTARDGNPPLFSEEFCYAYNAKPFGCYPADGWICMYMC